MLRKIVLALAAAATLGTAALAPSAASAHWKGGFGGGFGHGFHGGVRIIGGPAFVPVRCYWVERFTPFGVRLVKRCTYY